MEFAEHSLKVKYEKMEDKILGRADEKNNTIYITTQVIYKSDDFFLFS